MRTLRLKPTFLALTFLIVSGSAFAAPAQTATSSVAPDQAAPKFVQDIGDRAIGIAGDKSLSPTQRVDKYHDILSQSFDIQAIAHFVAGRAYNAATPEQQQEYLRLFKALVVKTYGDRMNLYSGEKLEVKGARSESDKDTVVNSAVTHADGSPPTPIDWRVREENGQPKIVDVVINGVSQSVTQRDEYSSIVSRDGGKLDELIEQMRKRVQQGDGNGGSPNPEYQR